MTFFPFKFRVSPPGGDFSDPVTSATLGIVQVYLVLVWSTPELTHSYPTLTAAPLWCYLNHREVFHSVTEE